MFFKSIIFLAMNETSYQASVQNSASLQTTHTVQSTSQIVASQHQPPQASNITQQHQSHQISLSSSSTLVPNGTIVANGSLSATNYTATTTVTSVTTTQPLIDTGRTIVQAPPRSLEPVFMAPSNSVQVKRVMHSEAYVQYVYDRKVILINNYFFRYIESLHNSKNQKTVSKWENSLQSNFRNTMANQKKIPYDWIKVLNSKFLLKVFLFFLECYCSTRISFGAYYCKTF